MPVVQHPEEFHGMVSVVSDAGVLGAACGGCDPVVVESVSGLVWGEPAHGFGVHHGHPQIFDISTGSAGADAVVDAAVVAADGVEVETLAQVFGRDY